MQLRIRKQIKFQRIHGILQHAYSSCTLYCLSAAGIAQAFWVTISKLWSSSANSGSKTCLHTFLNLCREIQTKSEKRAWKEWAPFSWRSWKRSWHDFAAAKDQNTRTTTLRLLRCKPQSQGLPVSQWHFLPQGTRTFPAAYVGARRTHRELAPTYAAGKVLVPWGRKCHWETGRPWLWAYSEANAELWSWCFGPLQQQSHAMSVFKNANWTGLTLSMPLLRLGLYFSAQIEECVQARFEPELQSCFRV